MSSPPAVRVSYNYMQLCYRMSYLLDAEQKVHTQVMYTSLLSSVPLRKKDGTSFGGVSDARKVKLGTHA